MIRRRAEVFLASADLKQVEKLLLEFFGAGMGAKRPIVVGRAAAEVAGNVHTRKRIRAHQLQQRRGAQFQQRPVSIREMPPRQRIKE